MRAALLLSSLLLATFAACSDSTNPTIPVEDSFSYQPPVLLEYHQPEYPRLAHAAGIEGTVTVRALVSPLGRAVDVRVVTDATTRIFEETCRYAARLNRWRPAMASNHPVAGWVTYDVDFRLFP